MVQRDPPRSVTTPLLSRSGTVVCALFIRARTAMDKEYCAIVDGGFTLRIDEPYIATCNVIRSDLASARYASEPRCQSARGPPVPIGGTRPSGPAWTKSSYGADLARRQQRHQHRRAPALMAERIVRLARLFGCEQRDRGTDCGFAPGPFYGRRPGLADSPRLATKASPV